MALHAGRSWRVGVAGLALAAFGVGGLTAPPALAAPSARAATSDPASLVDEFIGTQDNHAANTTESAYGDTTPGATTPFGMVDFNPTTYNTAGGSYTNQGGYEYDADQIRGFSLNRISGTGCAGTNGAEDFPVFPYAGALPGGVLPTVPSASGIKSYYTSFDHAQESATPGSYQVTLGNGIKSELTATTRTGDARFTFPASAASGTLVFDTAGSLNGSSHATVRILGNDVIEGSTTVQPTCKVGPSYTAYFYARFTTPFTAAGTWQDSAMSAVADLGASTDVSASSNAAHGTGAFVSFAPGSTAVADIGLSYVSADGARANLDSEVGRTGFDALRASAHRTWDSTLGQIRVGGGKPTGAARSAQLETFYTALYHATLHPNVFDDADGQYTGYDGKLHAVKPGHHEYTTYSGWDIYRDEAQLIALLFPDRASDMNQSITDLATQAGWFNWPMLDSAQNKMDGDSLDSVLASMDAFGATDYDRAGALRSMVDSQTLVPNDAPNAPAGGVPATNRRQGFYQYAALGFDSDTNGIAWPTSSDLEYTVDDFGIAQMAQRLGDDSAYGTFMQRAQGWQNLFDTGQDALAPRNKNGFDRGVNLKVNTGQFAEASGAQYGWMVPQNIAGLVAKKGGAAQVEAQLDAFFGNLAPGSTQANPGSNSPYAYMSNEIDSQDPELYNWIGRPDRTADVNQEIRDALWTDNDPDGLFGNDDLGALSAWYVWSSIGVFPAVYGRSELVVSGPAFSSVKITSSGPSHRTYTLNAPGQSDGSRYVTGMRVDGRASSASWLPQSFAQKGGTVDFTMSDHPGSWGTGKDDVPPSFADGSDAYNNIGATPSGEGDTGSFDASNNSYQAGLLPAAGATVALPGTSVTYTWPDTAAGAPDNWIPHGQTIAMGGVRAGQISFLGAATNGPSAGMASVNYTDGTHQDVPIDLNDWTSPNLPAGANTTVLTTAHRDNANGTQDNTPAMVYGTGPQKLDPWKTIASVTLPTATDNGVMHVFAIGTSPADAAPLQASAVLPDHSGRQVNADLVRLSGGAGGGAADYRVSVQWGDGRSGTATVLALGASGDYSAFGSHGYRSPGHYRVTVKVSDGASTRTVTTSLTVS